jgi:hypothetical protein
LSSNDKPFSDEEFLYAVEIRRAQRDESRARGA